MAITNDRVGQLLEGVSRNRRVIVSPEGVPLDIRVAGHGERLTALVIDLAIMLGVIIGLYVLLVLLLVADLNFSIGMTIITFAAFIVRNLYFIHFELAWQGRTPGKKICGLRVINRRGGELSPGAIIARNLTREVELFLPLVLMLTLDSHGGVWQQLSLLGWVVAIAALPFFNRDHLRAGDLIGGTVVISMPRRMLYGDLSQEATPAAAAAGGQAAPVQAYTFTHEQLALYGAFELQVLEELLRKPPTRQNHMLLADVAAKICKKIEWPEVVQFKDVRRFLTDFYTAERADLERGQLFGHLRADKNEAEKKR